ncbi:hypothetical protein [Wolbachia endosymbiont of Ctenocephalides felis wCfeT]|uniref:hypothetical protein n=1 Tax=Wolbachia endosymbiont of Ctenocephalides felis wCfeT TaxID=2732593 RepID=UPI001444AE6E|nr:hypothetical protein [Wolbachia endosymbiont of Ctenocephalides felis wCfeT]
MVNSINFLNDIYFFEEGASYTMCIQKNDVGYNCMDAIGRIVGDSKAPHISHFHEYTLPNDKIKRESISFDLEGLKITESGAIEGIPSAYHVMYKIDNKSFNNKDNEITFTAHSSPNKMINVKIQKNT